MGLIKNKDAESYFVTKRSRQLRCVVSPSKPDPITNLYAEGRTSAGFANTVEAPRSELFTAEKIFSQTTGTQNSKEHPVSKSAGA